MTNTFTASFDAAEEIFSKPGPRIGFGTATLYAGRQSNNSISIIEEAIDNGITYFDTARLYAEGEAEHVLGKVLPRHRSKIHIASKVGILPAINSFARRSWNKALKVGATKFGLGKVLPEPRWAQLEYGVFDPAAMRLSLEASLRALKTDHVDVLFLHECSLANAESPLVRSFIADAIAEGKARTWGVAATPPETVQIADRIGNGIPVYQTSYDTWLGRMSHHHDLLDAQVVRHSILAETLPAILSRCERDPEFLRFARSLGLDPDDRPGLVPALMAGALNESPGGVVLFSTKRPDNISKTMAAKNVPQEKVRAAQNLARRAVEELSEPNVLGLG